MNRKIVGILVMTLLISTAMTTIAVNENNYNFSESRSFKPVDVPDRWLKGADQYLTSNCGYGDEIIPPYIGAQEFKPTKEDLTAVALGFFKDNAPSGLKITVSIRDALDGDDLAVKIVNADLIKKNSKETWLMFDFTDITVISEKTYYILCSINGGVSDESILWYFNINNQYDRGGAWFSIDSGENWVDLEDHSTDFPQIDFCFITYYQPPPKNKPYINTPFLQFLEKHPHLFPLLRQLLRL